jgi:uncharacterized membrane protein YdbT with pleckstrin-like domain
LHWIVLVRSFLLGLLLAVGGLASLIANYYFHLEGGQRQAALIGGIALLVLGGISIVSGFVRRNATEVGVTNVRVLFKTGLMERRSIEVLLSKVESIGVDEAALGRMLGYGSVIIRGTGGTYETFEKIARPNDFRREVQQQVGHSS